MIKIIVVLIGVYIYFSSLGIAWGLGIAALYILISLADK